MTGGRNDECGPVDVAQPCSASVLRLKQRNADRSDQPSCNDRRHAPSRCVNGCPQGDYAGEDADSMLTFICERLPRNTSTFVAPFTMLN